MIHTTTLSPSSLGGLGPGEPGPAMAHGDGGSSVLRVSREIENIGARVPMSKKRITWRFIFADSQQVHTVMLEHSRMTAKKRLRLDGRRLFSEEQYCPGDWRYEFHVAKDHPTRLCVAIKDVKSTVVEERRLDSIYELFVDGRPWDQLEERRLPARRRNSSSVWSSELYARRVSRDERELERTGDEDNNRAVTAKCVSWTFAFGQHGTIHKLELRDLVRGDDSGEFAVILDSRLLTRVNHDDITDDFWEYEHTLSEQHELSVVVTLEGDGKRYDFFVDGSRFEDLGETDFVLQPGWFPVYSRTRGTSYFRNEHSEVSQWERPIMSRGGVAIDVPRRLSTQHLPPPTDTFDSDGTMRLSTGLDNQVSETAPAAPLPTVNGQTVGKKDEPNLLDFSEIAVHSSPTSQTQAAFAAFDPFVQLSQQQIRVPSAPSSATSTGGRPPRSRQAEPPVDLLS